MSSVFDRLKPGRPRYEAYDKILTMRLEGHTYDAISILLSVHRQTVATICQNNKLGGRIKLRGNDDQAKRF